MTKIALPGLALGLLALAAPAHADHGMSGHGGGAMSVMSPFTLPKGSFATGLAFSLTLPEERTDAELIDLAGQHIHAHTGDYTLITSGSLAYGLTDRVTLLASLPYVRRDDIRAGEHDHSSSTVNGVEEIGTVDGIGDLRLIAHARLADWHGGGFALMGGVKTPTGSTAKRSDDGERLEVEHQPGSGSWDLITGASAGFELGTVKVALSASREWTSKGAFDTELGDRTLVGLSLSRALGAMAHHDDDEGEAPHGHDSTSLFVEATYEVEGKQRIGGDVEEESGSKAIWLSPGVTHEWASGWSAGLAAGIPLWQEVGISHPDNKLRMTLSLGRRF